MCALPLYLPVTLVEIIECHMFHFMCVIILGAPLISEQCRQGTWGPWRKSMRSLRPVKLNTALPPLNMTKRSTNSFSPWLKWCSIVDHPVARNSASFWTLRSHTTNSFYKHPVCQHGLCDTEPSIFRAKSYSFPSILVQPRHLDLQLIPKPKGILSPTSWNLVVCPLLNLCLQLKPQGCRFPHN